MKRARSSHQANIILYIFVGLRSVWCRYGRRPCRVGHFDILLDVTSILQYISFEYLPTAVII